MAEAVVAFTREKLAEVLANWPGTGDLTWAMGFISAAPTAAEIAAIREAARLCDRVVVARLLPGKPVLPGLAGVIGEAGGDVLWLPKELSGRVKVTIEDEKTDVETTSLMAQVVLTVLPNLVVVPRGSVEVIRALRAFQGGWGEIFTLRMLA
ncbi:MAG TPA: hypothetical protein VHP58_02080 [Alphaproteobacteria bacterium]|nr:hypothetical protein [Alphaproteobacteria bacterium]